MFMRLLTPGCQGKDLMMGTSKSNTDMAAGLGSPNLGNVLSKLVCDTEMVRKHFFVMVRRGWFRKLLAHYGPDLYLFLDDLRGEASMEFVKKYRDGKLGAIKKPEGFLFGIIKFASIRENMRIERLFRFDSAMGDPGE
jgi:hypothetical protein